MFELRGPTTETLITSETAGKRTKRRLGGGFVLKLVENGSDLKIKSINNTYNILKIYIFCTVIILKKFYGRCRIITIK